MMEWREWWVAREGEGGQGIVGSEGGREWVLTIWNTT